MRLSAWSDGPHPVAAVCSEWSSMGIDLRLIGAMVVIAYLAYAFIGQSLSPLASSRRRARRLQLWYARSIALLLVLSSLVSLVSPIASLKDGVVLALTTAILPMAAVSLVFSALVLRRLYSRWRGRSLPEARREAVAPMSLAELHEREQRIRQSESTVPSGDDLLSHHEADRMPMSAEDGSAEDGSEEDGSEEDGPAVDRPSAEEARLSRQARQRHA